MNAHATILQSDADAVAFDYTKPFRTRDGRRARLVRDSGPNTFTIEILNEDGFWEHRTKFKANGCTYNSDASVFAELPHDVVNVIPQTDHVRRSLRPGMEAYQLRDGRPVKILAWDLDDEDAPIVISYPTNEIERLFGERRNTVVSRRPKNGRIFPNGEDTNFDVLEVTPLVTKWVRIYDAPKLQENGKRTFQGKEVAAERLVNWYGYDTEEEARAQMQGVRAVIKVEYREGEGVA